MRGSEIWPNAFHFFTLIPDLYFQILITLHCVHNVLRVYMFGMSVYGLWPCVCVYVCMRTGGVLY